MVRDQIGPQTIVVRVLTFITVANQIAVWHQIWVAFLYDSGLAEGYSQVLYRRALELMYEIIQVFLIYFNLSYVFAGGRKCGQ